MKHVFLLLFLMVFCLASSLADSGPMPGNGLAGATQGGDTIAAALEISLPFSGSGTTVGYANDYDEACPWGSWAPDVVYSYLPSEDIDIVVDLWGSDYDTKLFILNGNLLGIACNDDFYGNWISRLEMVTLSAGIRYYIIVDGLDAYGGNYEIQVYENNLEIPSEAVPEGEPTLYPGYVDQFNSGCNYSFDQPLMQELIGNESGELVLHCQSGWISHDQTVYDTDWFSFVIGGNGTVSIEFISQIKTGLAQIDPPECDESNVGQTVEAMMNSPVTMTVVGPPFSVAWVAAYPSFYFPSGFAHPEYSYLLSFSGLQEGPVAIEQVSWGAVKSLFR